ncbi:MAG TPA: phosphatidylserine decarboxylase [Gammaproteobacteria bacterium]|nr:phosphatidylserine decarboxylase [Gammaproteobacteria bacterium]
MARPLKDWLDREVAALRGRPLRWLSESHFFRDPDRPEWSDTGFFFPPADGIVLYARTLGPDEPVLDVKGRSFSLRELLRMPGYDRRSLVIGIFMTFYDVHVNRIPYAGRLSWRELDPIATHNYPMLPVEQSLLAGAPELARAGDYLVYNQRVLNTVTSLELGLRYYVLQVADYDVDCITPFCLKQHRSFAQNQRFSQIRYGSQVDLIVPLSPRHTFTPLVEAGVHVEGAVDPIVRIAAAPGEAKP